MMMMPGLIKDDGYDFDAIKFVFKMEGINKNKQKKLFPVILELINVIGKEKKKRIEK
jgi:hypothetical protein